MRAEEIAEEIEDLRDTYSRLPSERNDWEQATDSLLDIVEALLCHVRLLNKGVQKLPCTEEELLAIREFDK